MPTSRKSARNDADSPTRLSDHDPTVLLVRLAPVETADLGIEVEAIEAEVVAGQPMAFAATLANAGPDAAQFPGVGAVLDVEVDDLVISAADGWSCDTPVAATGTTTVSCSRDVLAAGDEAVFALSATAPATAIGREVSLTVAAASQTQDPDGGNDSAVAAVAVVEEPPSVVRMLLNGQQVGDVAGAAGESRLFRFDVPAGARNLRILSAGGTGDVTLYASRDAVPTPDDWQLRSQRPGNNEVVQLAAPQAGPWYIRIRGESAFARVTVRASYTP